MRPLHMMLLLLLTTNPAAADPPGLSARFAIDGARQLRGQIEGRAGPVAGGLSGGTLADPERAADFALYLGLRPDLPRADVELRFTQPVDRAPAVVLNFARPVGRRISVSAEIGAHEAGGAPVASVRLAATRRIAARGALDLTLTDASDAEPRAGLGVRLPF